MLLNLLIFTIGLQGKLGFISQVFRDFPLVLRGAHTHTHTHTHTDEYTFKFFLQNL